MVNINSDSNLNTKPSNQDDSRYHCSEDEIVETECERLRSQQKSKYGVLKRRNALPNILNLTEEEVC